MQRWFAETGVEYIRSYPSALIGDDDPDDLFTAAEDPPTLGQPPACYTGHKVNRGEPKDLENAMQAQMHQLSVFGDRQ